MRFTGTATFDASRSDTWAILSDPRRLAPCLPIRLPIEDADDGGYRAEGRVGNGWFSTMVRVDIDVTDVEPDRSLRITGRGGASGTTFEGWVAYVLRPGPVEGPTMVDWEVDLSVAGVFAGQASRIVAERGEEEVGRLLECLRAHVAG